GLRSAQEWATRRAGSAEGAQRIRPRRSVPTGDCLGTRQERSGSTLGRGTLRAGKAHGAAHGELAGWHLLWTGTCSWFVGGSLPSATIPLHANPHPFSLPLSHRT